MYVLDRDDRRVPQGQAVRQGQLAGRLRREGPAEPREVPDNGRHADSSARPRRHQLGAAVVQPADRPLLRGDAGRTRAPSRSKVSSRAPRARTIVRRRWARPTSCRSTTTTPKPYGVVRAFDPKTLDTKWEFRMSDITWGGMLATARGPGVQRRPRRLLPRARRQDRRAALEGGGRRARSTPAR